MPLASRRRVDREPELSCRSHNHLGCNPLRKCLTFPVRLWEDVCCNARTIVTEQEKAEWSRGRSDWGSRGRSPSRFGGFPPATARAGTSQRSVLTAIRRVKCSPMFAYVRLCSPMFAYFRVLGEKCLRPGVSSKEKPATTK